MDALDGLVATKYFDRLTPLTLPAGCGRRVGIAGRRDGSGSSRLSRGVSDYPFTRTQPPNHPFRFVRFSDVTLFTQRWIRHSYLYNVELEAVGYTLDVLFRDHGGPFNCATLDWGALRDEAIIAITLLQSESDERLAGLDLRYLADGILPNELGKIFSRTTRLIDEHMGLPPANGSASDIFAECVLGYVFTLWWRYTSPLEAKLAECATRVLACISFYNFLKTLFGNRRPIAAIPRPPPPGVPPIRHALAMLFTYMFEDFASQPMTGNLAVLDLFAHRDVVGGGRRAGVGHAGARLRL